MKEQAESTVCDHKRFRYPGGDAMAGRGGIANGAL